jgi:hypothetical protein
MRTPAAIAGAGAIAMAMTCLLTNTANAQWRDSGTFDRSGLIHVGHDNIVVDPSVRRYTGMVAALGTPNAKGQLFSFKPAPVGPRSFPLKQDDLRGWRLTVLAGKRFGEVFTVSGNTESEITVSAEKGPIDGMGEKDVFIIESVDANGVSMFPSAAGASAAAPSAPPAGA